MSPSTLDLFHRRLEEKNGKIPNTYFYTLTDSFKNRLVMAFHNFCESLGHDYRSAVQEYIINNLRMAFGVLSLDRLSNKKSYNPYDELVFFVLHSGDDNKIVSVVEYLCRLFKKKYAIGYLGDTDFISDINLYFRYDRIGYKFIREGDGFIVFIEDEHFSNECTQKSLSLLTQKGYGEAQNFFIDAYKKTSCI